jgi:hypothetical protein
MRWPSEAEFRARIAAEQRERRRNARAFAAAAERGDVEQFFCLPYPDDALDIDWKMAFRGVAKLGRVTPEISEAFVTAWIERKMWPLMVGDRRALADALYVLLPPQAGQESLTLYRGTTWNERMRRLYGFSWSRDRETARRFAKNHAETAKDMADNLRIADSAAGNAGIVLQASAPGDGIFLIREGRNFCPRSVPLLSFPKSKVQFNKGEGGFRNGNLYVSCFNISDGKFVATGNPNSKKLLGTDGRTFKDAHGDPLDLNAI